jgi:hypothetical protein
VLFVRGMRLTQLACWPGKIELKLQPDFDLWSVFYLGGFIQPFLHYHFDADFGILS